MSNKISIQEDGINIGDVRVLNFVAGTNITLTTTVDPNHQRINIEIESTGGGGSGLTHGEVMGRVSLGF